MEHFYNYIQRKGKDNVIKELSGSKLKISEKVDGTPLQIVRDDDDFTFHSKGKDMVTPGPLLRPLDFVMNPAFYDRYVYLDNILKKDKVKRSMSMIKMLNFEIVVDNNHHIVQYKDKPKNNMYILSGTTINGNQLSHNYLCAASAVLRVPVPSFVIIDKDVPIEEIVDFVENYGDPKNPKYDDIKFKNKISAIINKGKGRDFINENYIEGVVFDFIDKGITLKIDSPYFLETFKNNKEKKLSSNEENEITSVLDKAISLIDKSKLSKKSNDQLENLILNFNSTIASTASSLKDFVECCNTSSMSRKDGIIKAIPKKYIDNIKPNMKKAWFTGFINFAWLFRKNRKGLLIKANDIVDLMK